MLNSNVRNSNSNNINLQFNNAVSGLLQKSHPLSVIRRCHIESPLAKTIFSEDPRVLDRNRKAHSSCEESITVLQVMLANEGEVFIEFIYNNDLTNEL